MSKRLFLEVDTSQIDIKKILKKDFLELSMRAISSANPNRNNSWFTKESMEKSIGSFVNKPILGYFENGDFVSHNGDWEYDPETEMSYWNTLGTQGERILGTIRESDEVKIIEDENGLSWVVFSCILWTQYCFKQVKRLLKDAKRAQKNGGSTKNISVEVDITDYEILENGVMKINEFKLIGVTILGSRNSVKVEPGIEDAELSVIDVLGHDVYSKQEQALRLAYEKLDQNAVEKEETILENENIVQTSEELENTSVEETPVETNSQEEVVTEEIVDKVDEPVSELNNVESSKFEEQSEVEEGAVEEETSSITEEKEEESQITEEPVAQQFEEDHQPDPVHDIAWLISDCAWNIEGIESTIEYYKESDSPYKEYVINVLTRIVNRQKDSERDLGELLGKITSGEITEEDQNQEALYAKYETIDNAIAQCEKITHEYEELTEKYSVLEKENASNVEKIANYEHNEYIKSAMELIDSANIKDENVVKQFKLDCENNVITSLEDLKVKVALYTFDNEKTVESSTFSAPVETPNVAAVFNNKKTKTTTVGHWDALHAYVHDGE